MKWLALIVLVLVGLIEFVLRLVAIVICTVLVVPIIVLANEDQIFPLLRPVCFTLAERLIDA
jgi:hypothetical protein